MAVGDARVHRAGRWGGRSARDRRDIARGAAVGDRTRAGRCARLRAVCGGVAARDRCRGCAGRTGCASRARDGVILSVSADDDRDELLSRRDSATASGNGRQPSDPAAERRACLGVVGRASGPVCTRRGRCRSGDCNGVCDRPCFDADGSMDHAARAGAGRADRLACGVGGGTARCVKTGAVRHRSGVRIGARAGRLFDPDRAVDRFRARYGACLPDRIFGSQRHVRCRVGGLARPLACAWAMPWGKGRPCWRSRGR